MVGVVVVGLVVGVEVAVVVPLVLVVSVSVVVVEVADVVVDVAVVVLNVRVVVDVAAAHASGHASATAGCWHTSQPMALLSSHLTPNWFKKTSLWSTL